MEGSIESMIEVEQGWLGLRMEGGMEIEKQ